MGFTYTRSGLFRQPFARLREIAPFLYFHGFQGSRLERVPGLDAVLTNLNIRLISPDRPGIGLSTPLHVRNITAWANDVRQLTERVLGPGEPFSILGFSAGATYALACGQLRGLQAMSLVAGIGLPYLISSWRRYSQEAWRVLLSAKLANFRSATFLRIEKKRHRVYGQWESYFGEMKRDLSSSESAERRPERPLVLGKQSTADGGKQVINEGREQ